jgi:hypothetical protein
MRELAGLGGRHARRLPRLRCHNLPSCRAWLAGAERERPAPRQPSSEPQGDGRGGRSAASAERRPTSTFSRDIAGRVSFLLAPGSSAAWEPVSTSHRPPGPGSCARALPETPRLRPMDAERFGRPGESPRSDRKLQKSHCGRPSPRCERRSCDRSCVQSPARAGRLSDIGFPVGVGARAAGGSDATEFAAFPASGSVATGGRSPVRLRHPAKPPGGSL